MRRTISSIEKDMIERLKNGNSKECPLFGKI
jgi:hypothetical protein